MSAKKITPAQFLERLKEIYSDCRFEEQHVQADKLMEETLRALGYGNGVEYLRRQTRWYS